MAANTVALRKESVDRNDPLPALLHIVRQSLSARRAWIEIVRRHGRCFPAFWSLSARRAWIEIGWTALVAWMRESLSARRAWIEINNELVCTVKVGSLSARRAWIEMAMTSTTAPKT